MLIILFFELTDNDGQNFLAGIVHSKLFPNFILSYSVEGE
jgi:hypothetical protein